MKYSIPTGNDPAPHMPVDVTTVMYVSSPIIRLGRPYCSLTELLHFPVIPLKDTFQKLTNRKT